MINYQGNDNLLVITKGHPFDKPAFFSMFDAMQRYTWTHVEQPAATHLFRSDVLGEYAAFVLYDLPGIQFRPGQAPEFIEPPLAMRAGFEALLDGGQPFVFLHHAIAGWPAWDRYAEVIGGRYFYKAASYKGVWYEDSGYRHECRFIAEPVVDHPVTAGFEAGIEMIDELYLYETFETDDADFLPLLRARYPFVDREFYSTREALAGRLHSNEGWSHKPGSDLIAWARRVGRSPIVYLQGGDGPTMYANAQFRRLLRNAIEWVTGDAARAWAKHAAASPKREEISR